VIRRPILYLIVLSATFAASALTEPAAAQTGQAYTGSPFGVGVATVPIRSDHAEWALATEGMFLEERDGRTHYPVFTTAGGPAGRLLGEVLGSGPWSASPSSMTVLFLFTGTEPLELTIRTPTAQRIVVRPERPRNPRVYDRTQQRWWREFNARARQQAQHSDYPPLVQTYLNAMLSRRLGLGVPLLSRLQDTAPEEPYETFQLVTGVESLRMETLRRSTLGQDDSDQAPVQALPPDIRWNPLPPLEIADQVDIEPIAMRVPEDCFYVRFGSFENYLWLDRLQRDYGGDIGRMVTLRGYDAGSSQRFQQQLALRTSVLADVLGPTIVADVALIGRDLFVREGAAVGVLFRARNSALLANDLARQRSMVLQEQQAAGATETKVQIGGRQASLLSTPDNRLRSFYVADGEFHLVTNSRAIGERFLAVSDQQGQGSLGASPEFLHARTLMPTQRDDTIFVYLGTAFQQGLLSPQYQVELARRLRAATDLELLLMATWAAAGEGRPSDSIEQLIRGGFLPKRFGQRVDGSQPNVSGQQVGDSLRGGRGSFLPVPDVAIEGISQAEADRLAKQAAYYENSWKRMDPLMAGIKRFALDGPDQERIVIDAHVSPFVQQKYGGIVSAIGPPTSVRIRPAAGDIITAQVVLRGGLLSPQVPAHHLFLGVQDGAPLGDMAPSGLLGYLTLLRTAPGYLGAWPKPGFLDWLPLGLGGGSPDALGYSQVLLGVWRRQWLDFSALAMDRQLLERVTPDLAPQEVADDAQIRIHVGDLSQAQLRGWVNNLAYGRAYLASLGNAKLLHTMSQQLGVPHAQALRQAEHLLDARLVCSLGGEYQWNEQTGLWTSTAWPPTRPDQHPPDYAAPLLDWFRGFDAKLVMHEESVLLQATLDLQRKPHERPRFQLPRFRLFGSGKEKPQSDQDDSPPENP
jgi:hypothetical protein